MAGNRHDLVTAPIALGKTTGGGFSETVRGTMFKVGLIAAIPKPVAKAIRRKGPAELVDQERVLT
ncbi:hypothetical protein JP75_11470 [Devosia riboflavina]|uniref:Uncharacterized protein n=1 Tax=Devosia riboflavina TaxID=46914 RepID=A0A087M266_9HYPH|nr:hypothetical protein JP75_11470 [Devosia riboflavina]